jgi:hypothetical protein
MPRPLCPRPLDLAAAGARYDDQPFCSADFRSKLRCDIAAIAPIRSINIYIFKVHPGFVRPPRIRHPRISAAAPPYCNKRDGLMKGNLRQTRGRPKTQHGAVLRAGSQSTPWRWNLGPQILTLM